MNAIPRRRVLPRRRHATAPHLRLANGDRRGHLPSALRAFSDTRSRLGVRRPDPLNTHQGMIRTERLDEKSLLPFLQVRPHSVLEQRTLAARGPSRPHQTASSVVESAESMVSRMRFLRSSPSLESQSARSSVPMS
nr:TPA_asm: m96.5 ORF [Murid betaherpesvirus 1]DBA08041.1 TPA_asm: m96.5 ORF [Murid betaherpesvirus 1]